MDKGVLRAPLSFFFELILRGKGKLINYPWLDELYSNLIGFNFQYLSN